MNHPRENDLALLAGGEAGRIQRFLLGRHVRTCVDCQDKIAQYQEVRTELAESELPDLNWSFLAAEMRANIRLGLEAGACVRTRSAPIRWTPRFVIAFASLVLLVASGFFVRGFRLQMPAADAATTVLQLTRSGVEFSTGAKSLELLNHHGKATNQTVSAQGDIETRYIDGDTGAVTINSVYLQ